jgi:hypothetical protein
MATIDSGDGRDAEAFRGGDHSGVCRLERAGRGTPEVVSR